MNFSWFLLSIVLFTSKYESKWELFAITLWNEKGNVGWSSKGNEREDNKGNAKDNHSHLDSEVHWQKWRENQVVM